MSSAKPLIVISYAHADEPEHPAEGEIRWLSFVTGYLRPAIKQGAVELWLDRLMRGGDDWDPEIERKLRACDIFLLLVSRHSMSSDYVVDKEIAIIRERQAKGEDVHFYPLVLTPTPEIALDLVRDKNLRPRDGRPLSDFFINDRYRQMNETANEIAGIAGEIATRRGVRPPSSSANEADRSGSNEPAIKIILGTELEIDDEKSLEGWLMSQSPQHSLIAAARVALRIAPLVVRDFDGPNPKPDRSVEFAVSAIFQATALAWAASRYPHRARELGALATAAAGRAQATVNADLGSASRLTSSPAQRL